MTKNEYKKKILILGLILIAVSSTLTAISAESSFTNIEQSKTLVNNQLTINDIHFTIPNGYEEIENDTDITATEIDDDGETETETEDIDGTVVDGSTSSEFKNSAGDKIEIKVGIKANDQKIEKIAPVNFEQKTIAGKDGYLIKELNDGKEQYKFEYLENGKLVKIVASSEDIISQIIA